MRHWYGEASGKGRSISDTLRRSYINRHLERLFGGSQPSAAGGSNGGGACRPAHPGSGRRQLPCRRLSARWPLLAAKRLPQARTPSWSPPPVERLGIPVYLSGMARGLLGRDDPLQLRHQRRQALKEADCVILAGAPLRFPPRLWTADPPFGHADRRQPQPQGRAPEPPPGHRRHRRRRPVP